MGESGNRDGRESPQGRGSIKKGFSKETQPKGEQKWSLELRPSAVFTPLWPP